MTSRRQRKAQVLRRIENDRARIHLHLVQARNTQARLGTASNMMSAASSVTTLMQRHPPAKYTGWLALGAGGLACAGGLAWWLMKQRGE